MAKISINLKWSLNGGELLPGKYSYKHQNGLYVDWLSTFYSLFDNYDLLRGPFKLLLGAFYWMLNFVTLTASAFSVYDHNNCHFPL